MKKFWLIRENFAKNSAHRQRALVSRQRGDTLVEVLLAITILSVVAIGSMAVMNRGNALVQAALERTAVRAEINSQTELLDYIRDNNATLWANIKSRNTSADNAKDNCKATSGKSFYINATNLSSLSVTDPVINSGQGTNGSARAEAGKGLWIDVVSVSVSPGGNQIPYYDFYIKACWTPIGSGSGSVSKSLTIVRMYDN